MITWALRNVFPDIVSLAPSEIAEIDVFVPKFGRLSGTLTSLHDLAKWAKSPVTVCLNTIYLSHDVHCGNPDKVVHGSNNSYYTSIENVPAAVRFEQFDQDMVYPTPDMFDTPNLCRYVQRSSYEVPYYACTQGDNIAIRADEEGNVVLWQEAVDSPTANLEVTVFLFAAVVGIAMVVDLSRTVTYKIKTNDMRPIELSSVGLDHWKRIILADILVATVWYVVANVAIEGPLFMVDPSVGIAISTTNAAIYGTVRATVFVAVAAVATWQLLNEPKVLQFKDAVSVRFTAEVTLLTAIVATVPKHVAPQFHAVLNAIAGTIATYIAGRDYVIGSCKLSAVATAAANVLALGPVFAMSNAVPPFTEYIIAAALEVQVAAFGTLMAY